MVISPPCLAQESGTRLAGQILPTPCMLGGRMDQGAYLGHVHAPMLSTDQVQYYWEMYLGKSVSRDVEVRPMATPDHSHLLPAIIVAAECDPSQSDSLQYAEKLTAAVVNVTLHIEEGLSHGYIRARHSTTSDVASFVHII